MNAVTKPKTDVVTMGQSHNALTPMELLDRAITSGSAPEVLAKMMELQERWDKTQAIKAFNEAISAAKAEIPVIRKNRHVGFDSKRTDSRTDYDHEDLGEIARTIDPILSKFGLSYRFRTEADATNVKVTCIISHRLGHSEENSLPALHDKSGNKNPIQAIGSTVTFLQRYTLKAALGLAAAKDDDSKGAGGRDQTIDAEQVQSLRDRLKAMNMAEEKFLNWARTHRPHITSMEEIPAGLYDNCVTSLERTAAKGKQS